MSRSRKGKPRCPEGHKCSWCGPKTGADARDARMAQVEVSDSVQKCGAFKDGVRDDGGSCGVCVGYGYL